MRTVQGSVTITYAVPITFIVLTPKLDPVNVVDGVSSTFSCVTSESRPPATVSWFKGIDDITAFSNNVTTTFITTSTLTYTPSKEDQGKRIRCEGSNGGTTVTTSPSVHTMHDPPSRPVFHLGGTTGPRITENSLSVIRGKSTSVACISTGNPEPTYSSWNGSDQLWTFIANTDTTRTCLASNTLNPTGFKEELRSISSALNIKVVCE
ncbi:CADM4-like protein [Mya arenaria]|uniref:CADM4-like protein n=1 Tax=Mya arenaria TaxID=6604 RepID=A0ABY7D8G5_MYAAR|nr:CADM4-like protein [Mya arenaria]